MFSFGDASGTTEPSNKNDKACDDPSASPEAIVIERVRIFSDKILRYVANSDKYSDGEDIEVLSNCDEIQVVSPPPIYNTMAISSEELMTKFRNILSSSIDDLLNNVDNTTRNSSFNRNSMTSEI